MQSALCPDGVDFQVELVTGEAVTIKFREIRREHTGVHALVAVFYEQIMLAYDTFNIGRGEDLERLAKRAYGRLPGMVREALSKDDLAHHLDIAAVQTPRKWEQERLQIIEYTDDDQPTPLEFAIQPFIIKGGGTVFFGPPGAGKTYLMQSMALAISTGQRGVWNVHRSSPVLYINLERDGNSLLRREKALKSAMRLTNTQVFYLHGRGMSLSSIYRKVREWLQDRGECGVMLDSISRAGNGPLNEDQSANRFVDMMNSLPALWWSAIGHTPRADPNHLFGSVHFDAGMDIGVKVKTETRQTSVGICLEITKANDIGHYPKMFYALDFEKPDSPIIAIRRAEQGEYPGLLETNGEARLDDLIATYIENTPNRKADATTIAKAIERDASNVSKVLRNNSRFAFAGKDARQVYYGLTASQHDDGDHHNG